MTDQVAWAGRADRRVMAHAAVAIASARRRPDMSPRYGLVRPNLRRSGRFGTTPAEWTALSIERASNAAPPCKYSGAMGLLHHHKDDANPNRYIMKERLLALGGTFYIENAAGLRCFWVDGKVLRVRETILFRETNGTELFKVQQRKVRLRDTMKIEDPHGHTVATIHEHLIDPIHKRFDISIEGEQDMTAKGNVLAHEYKIDRTAPSVAATITRSGCGSATPTRLVPGESTHLWP